MATHDYDFREHVMEAATKIEMFSVALYSICENIAEHTEDTLVIQKIDGIKVISEVLRELSDLINQETYFDTKENKK